MLSAITRSNGKVLMTPAQDQALSADLMVGQRLPVLVLPDEFFPPEAIVGGDYVRRPAPAPTHGVFCERCLACRCGALAPQTPATGEKA